jgi:hypothetical protein
MQMVRLETRRELVEERTRGTRPRAQLGSAGALAQSAGPPRLEGFSVANDRPPDEVGCVLGRAG